MWSKTSPGVPDFFFSGSSQIKFSKSFHENILFIILFRFVRNILFTRIFDFSIFSSLYLFFINFFKIEYLIIFITFCAKNYCVNVNMFFGAEMACPPRGKILRCDRLPLRAETILGKNLVRLKSPRETLTGITGLKFFCLGMFLFWRTIYHIAF